MAKVMLRCDWVRHYGHLGWMANFGGEYIWFEDYEVSVADKLLTMEEHVARLKVPGHEEWKETVPD